jgi:multiple sugar transport system permease protein
MFDLRHPLARGIFLAATLIIGFFLFFPIYWLVISALKPNGELYRIIPTAFPHEFSLQHFITAVTKGNLPQQLKNSLIASTTSALLNTTLAVYAAYSFAKYRYAGRRGVMLTILSAQMFPFGLLLISIYPMLSAFGLIDTRVGLILSYIVFSLPVSIYMLYSYFSQVPDELIDAGRADGASDLRILHTIVLPISVPALVTVFLYAFMWSWNDLLYAMTIIISAEKRTIGPGLLLSYLNETNSDWGAAMAASLLASLPVVIAFAFLQRHFVAGVTAGAVK